MSSTQVMRWALLRVLACAPLFRISRIGGRIALKFGLSLTDNGLINQALYANLVWRTSEHEQKRAEPFLYHKNGGTRCAEIRCVFRAR